jgi:hypothetical protein
MKLEQMGLNWVKMIFGENIDDLIVQTFRRSQIIIRTFLLENCK